MVLGIIQRQPLSNSACCVCRGVHLCKYRGYEREEGRGGGRGYSLVKYADYRYSKGFYRFDPMHAARMHPFLSRRGKGVEQNIIIPLFQNPSSTERTYMIGRTTATNNIAFGSSMSE